MMSGRDDPIAGHKDWLSRRAFVGGGIGVVGGVCLAGCTSNDGDSSAPASRELELHRLPPIAARAGEDGLASIRFGDDAMEWVGTHGRWGVPVIVQGGAIVDMDRVGGTAVPQSPVGVERMTDEYGLEQAGLVVVAERRIIDGSLEERFTISLESGAEPNPERRLAIRVPLPDDVEGGAAEVLPSRSVSHVWAEGTSAWICSLRLDGTAPHLGLVVVEGAMRGYSVSERPVTAETLLGAALSNDRGCLMVHPDLAALAAGESQTLTWRVFGHDGWKQFWQVAGEVSPDFVRLDAERLVVSVGEETSVRAVAANSAARGPSGRFLINGQQAGEGAATETMVRPIRSGPIDVRFEHGEGEVSTAALYAIPDPGELISARVGYLLDVKQVRKPGDPLDGAFTVVDTDSGERVINELWADHNAARERVGAGVLLGLALAGNHVPDGRVDAARDAFDAFYRFYRREIEGSDGVVHDTIGRSGTPRLFNASWGMQVHLAAHRATGASEPLEQFARTVAAFYGQGGEQVYPIGLPITWGLGALSAAGMNAQHDAVLAAFGVHADVMVRNGRGFPTSEVAYEQGMVGPAVQVLAEMHLAAPDSGYLAAARDLLPLLEVFGGRQPHHRLHDVAVRHWDDFWFGGLRLLGDTMPHHWSCVSAVAMWMLAESEAAERAEALRARADQILWANLVDVSPSGSASCAFVFPETVEGAPAATRDPWDNDQDWALVHWLQRRDGLLGMKALDVSRDGAES